MKRPCSFVFAILLFTFTPPSHSAVIDFETPPLGAASRQTINPYIDAATGVLFVSPGFEVGLVRNFQTSACVEPADNNQKLGMGPIGGDAVGLSNNLIRADFPTTLPGPVMVSVEFQAALASGLRLRLYNEADIQVASVLVVAQPAGGTCGFPGPQRARTVVSAMSMDDVARVRMDVPNGAVFVLDNFTFESLTVPTESATWGRIKALYRTP